MFGRLATVCGALVCTVIAAPALAQDKPFVSTATATDITRPQARVDYEVGTADQAFQSDSAFQPEQRVNVQASLGRVTLIGRFGVSQVGSAYQSSQAGEALFTLTSSTARMSIAAGGGVEHEAAGTNVLMSRIVVGSASDNWLSQGNVVLQHPLAPGRDPLDVLLTWAASRGGSRRTRPSVLKASAKISKGSGIPPRPRAVRACSSARRFISRRPAVRGSFCAPADLS